MHFGVVKKVLALSMAILMIVTPLLAQTDMDDYMQGQVDGEQAAKGNGMWFFAGCLLGLTGVLIAYIVDPSPPSEYLVGKSMNYVQGFKEGYAEKAKKENAKFAIMGCAVAAITWTVVYIALLTSIDDDDDTYYY